MTFFAGDFRVPTLELKSGLAMVEIRPADAAPSGCIMAALAALFEFPVMDVAMTVEAIVMFYPGKLQEIRIIGAYIVGNRIMAFVAVNIEVFAC